MTETFDHRQRWLRIAFTIQAVLLVLCIAAVLLVTIEYRLKLKQFADQLANQQKLLNQQAQDLKSGEASLEAAKFTLGRTYARTGDYDSALSQFEDVLSSNPADTYSARELAKAYIRKRQPAVALNLLTPILKRFAVSRNFVTAAMLQCSLGDKEDAQSSLVSAVHSDHPANLDDPDLVAACPPSILTGARQ